MPACESRAAGERDRAPARPDPVVVARLAAQHHGDGRALPPEPLYLREADVTLPAAAP